MAHIRRDKRARSALRTEELPVKRGRLGEGTDSGRCNLSLLSDTGLALSVDCSRRSKAAPAAFSLLWIAPTPPGSAEES